MIVPTSTISNVSENYFKLEYLSRKLQSLVVDAVDVQDPLVYGDVVPGGVLVVLPVVDIHPLPTLIGTQFYQFYTSLTINFKFLTVATYCVKTTKQRTIKFLTDPEAPHSVVIGIKYIKISTKITKQYVKLTTLHGNCPKIAFENIQVPATATSTILPSRSHYFINWNKFMHILNGNIKKQFFRFSDIKFQNVPGTKNVSDIQVAVDIVLASRPVMLGIGEVSYDKLSLCHFPGYTIYRGKQSNSKKIRMNLLVKNGLVVEEMDLECEVPTCTVKYGDWTVCFLYREWMKCGDSKTRDLELQKSRWKTFIPKWKSLTGKSLVLGDYNFCFLNGNSPYQRQFQEMRDLVEENFLLDGWSQLVQDCTRHQRNNIPSLLDHVYSNDLSFFDRVYNLSIIDSDHNCIGVRLRHDGQVHYSKIIEKRDYEGINDEEFERIFLTSHSWNIFVDAEGKERIKHLWDIYLEQDIDEALAKFNQRVNSAMDRLAPKKSITIRKKFSPWITSEIKDQLQVRKNLHTIAQNSDNDPEAWLQYKKYRNNLRFVMRKAQDDYTRCWLNTDNETKKWTRIKQYTGLDKDKNNSEMEIQTNFGKTKNPSILSNFMNVFFKDKVDRLKQRTNPNLQRSLFYTKKFLQGKEGIFDEEFSFSNTDLDTLHRHVKSLSNTSSVGVDDIPTVIVKKFKAILLPPLLHIINLCLTQSQYPTLWKTGCISPIPKKGNLSQASNWRPIVLNCVVSKLLERVMNEQIMNYMRRNHYDPPSQHAYRPEKSCNTALTELDTFIQKNRDRGWVVGLCLTDQSAAFNVLQKDILLGKLQLLGFTSSALKLIQDYLTGRKTKCTVNGHTSSTVDLHSGVGEGSVLGPSLYTLGQICVSAVCTLVKEDLYNQHNITVDTLSCEYADDVTGCLATRHDTDLQLAINILMSQYQDYFSACGLCLNQDKCAVMILRSKAKTQDIFWNGKPAETKVKLLGLWIDSRYEFLDHVNHVVKVCSYKMSCIRKVAHWLSDKNLKQVVTSLVLSQISYCAEIYLRLPKVRTKVQKVLNSAARLALREDRYANCEKMMQKLEWLNLDNLYRQQLLCSLRRYLNSGVTEYTLQWLDWEARLGIRRRLLRISWTPEKNHGKLSFLQAAVSLWNRTEVGRQVFTTYELFKEWIFVKLKSLYGNKNLL